MYSFEFLTAGEILNHSFSVRLTYALVHFFWQGAFIGLTVFLVGRMLRSSSAKLRYLINVVAMLLMAVCVPATFLFIQPESTAITNATGHQPASVLTNTTDEHVEELHSATALDVVNADIAPPEGRKVESDLNFELDSKQKELEIVQSNAVTPLSAMPIEETSGHFVENTRHSPRQSAVEFIAPVATVIYLLGVLLMLLRLSIALMGGQRLRGAASPLTDHALLRKMEQQARRVGLRVLPTIAYCQRITVPVVVGVLRPMILLPMSLSTGLSNDQLQAVLAHELAHIRRFDLLVNLLQRIIESMLFFHPAVWYVSQSARRERENCCDDLVLSSGWKRIEYADALVRMAEICATMRGGDIRQRVAALAATDPSPSQFKNRVLRLLGNEHVPKLSLSRTGVVFALFVVGAISLTPWLIPERDQVVDASEVMETADEGPKRKAAEDLKKPEEAKQVDETSPEKQKQRDLLAELDDAFKKAVEMNRHRQQVLEAARLLESTNTNSRWTNYMAGAKLLRQTRSKAAIPLLLKYMYVHTEMKGTGSGAVKEYVDTISILTGTHIENPYKYQADRVTPTREGVKKLFDTWWKPNKDKITTDMDDFTSEQIAVVVDKLLKRSGNHYTRSLSEARQRGKGVNAYLMYHLMYYEVMGESSDQPAWLNEEIHPAMIPHLLARSGYEEKPAKQPRRESNQIGFDVVDMLASLRKNGEADQLDAIASDARQNSAVRLTCILSLYKAGERLKSDELLSILAKEKKRERRLATILALRYSREMEKVVPALVKQLDDRDVEIATAAACALQDARPPAALSKMLELVSDLDEGQAAIMVFKMIAKYQNKECQQALADYLAESLKGGKMEQYLYRALSAFEEATGQRWTEAGAHEPSYYKAKAREALAWWNERHTKVVPNPHDEKPLEDGDLKRLEIAEAELSVARARLQLAIAQKNLHSTELVRMTELAKSGAVKPSEVVKARANFKVAEESVAKLTKQVAAAAALVKKIKDERPRPKEDLPQPNKKDEPKVKPNEEPKAEKKEEPEPRKDEDPFGTSFYQGEVHEKWLASTLGSLQSKVPRADAIVVATQAIATGGEFTEAAYIVRRVLKGREFLKPHLKRKDFGGKIGVRDYVMVEYLDSNIKSSYLPVSEPGGPTLLFLRSSKRHGNVLSILGDWVHEGMAYATKDVVQRTEEMIDRLDQLLGYFKSNGFPLQKTSDGYVIDSTPEGAFSSTSFFVFPPHRDHASIHRTLSGINAASVYNPYCRIAMFLPGSSLKSELPKGWKWPARFAEYSLQHGRFLTMFRDYRPKRSEDSPSQSEVAWFTDKYASDIRSHFEKHGLKVTSAENVDDQNLLHFELSESPVDGVQILFGVQVYPPRFSERAITQFLWHYHHPLGALNGAVPGKVNENCVLCGPWSSQTKEQMEVVERTKAKIVEAFSKLDLNVKPMPVPKSGDEARVAFFSLGKSLFGEKWGKEHARILSDMNKSLFVRRQSFADAHRRVTGTLMEREKRHAIRFGDLNALDRKGECWSIEASQYPYTIAGYVDVETGKLIFVWNVPEG